MQESKPTEQTQKPREFKHEASESQSKDKEGPTRPKPEATTAHEQVQRMPVSRESERVQQHDSSSQREDKPKIDSRQLKEFHLKLTEKESAVRAKLDLQVNVLDRLATRSTRFSNLHYVTSKKDSYGVGIFL